MMSAVVLSINRIQSHMVDTVISDRPRQKLKRAKNMYSPKMQLWTDSRFFFFFMTVGVRTNLLIPRLIPRDFEAYSQVLTSIALRELELLAIGEQT